MAEYIVTLSYFLKTISPKFCLPQAGTFASLTIKHFLVSLYVG